MHGSNFVNLNVGGKIYAAPIDTLRRYPLSTLGQMFTTDHNIGRTVFIDGDGTMFKYILNFLRRNELLLPQDFKEYDLLLAEARIYQIQPIIDQVEERKARSESRESLDFTVLLIGDGSEHFVYYYCIQVRGVFNQQYVNEFQTRFSYRQQSAKATHSFERYRESLVRVGYTLVERNKVSLVNKDFWTFEMSARGVIPQACNFVKNERTVYELWTR